MNALTALSLFAAVATSASVDLRRRDTPLDVRLVQTGNSGVHASLTNTGSDDLKLFTAGTFLDENAVEKVQVFSGDARLPFDGLRLIISHVGLSEDAFTVVKAGETVEADFDAAELHDLSEGGIFNILTSGAFSSAELNSTEITGTVPFKSNTVVSEEVDGSKALAIHRTFQAKAKRTIVQDDCVGSQRQATIDGINSCAALASAARVAARNDSARLQEYFKSSSDSVASTVEGVFALIEEECGSTTSGKSRYHCTDVYGACSGGVIAYTLPSQSYMVNCPTYFGMLAQNPRCHGQDQGSTILHETTHLRHILGTSDYGGYGYSFVQQLSSEQNLNHADTYTLFAQSVSMGC
ncbi:neutral protease [Plectosphaerella plurivora]|uniref:Neutral protease 2 n=1 Tax=Plectosphaerella plurivora TaxID=936078 RepID=A0A9P8V549_9PEZI|nr:neutral protease [Plectosphaerella plurivora]